MLEGKKNPKQMEELLSGIGGCPSYGALMLFPMPSPRSTLMRRYFSLTNSMHTKLKMHDPTSVQLAQMLPAIKQCMT